jgi:hypothetical protein
MRSTNIRGRTSRSTREKPRTKESQSAQSNRRATRAETHKLQFTNQGFTNHHSPFTSYKSRLTTHDSRITIHESRRPPWDAVLKHKRKQ